MKKSLLNALPLISIFLLWNAPFFFKGYVIQGAILLELLGLTISLFTFLSVSAIYFKRLGALYLILSLSSAIFAIVFGVAGSLRFVLFYLASFAIASRYFLSLRERGDLAVGSASVGLLLLLLALSTSLRFIHLGTLQSTGYLYSIYNDASPAGVPFTYAYGLVFVLGPFSLTISPITAFLFPLVAYLTSANTFLIINTFRTRGVTSVTAIVVTSIACQCENTIGIVSGTVSSLALSILPYFIFISAALLMLTNIYLHRPRKMRIPEVNKLSMLLLFISILAVEFAIIYTGMIYNLAVFGFSSFLTLFSGFLLGQLLKINWRIPVYIVILPFVVQTVMFAPSFIREALTSPTVFELYTIAGMIAGLLISLSFRNRNVLSKITIFEFVFSMETMIAAVLLFLSIFSVSIFTGYSEIAVVDFSVFILIVSLPLMWFSNIYLLSARTFGA